jgi:hypothetical protein
MEGWDIRFLTKINVIPIPRKFPLHEPLSLAMKWYPMAYPNEKVLRTYSQSVRANTKDLPWTSCQLMKALFDPEYLA